MMKKPIIIFIFIKLFFIVLTKSQLNPPPPQCKTTTNVNPTQYATPPTDLKWWYLNQLRFHGAIYSDSQINKVLEIQGYNTRDTDEDSPFLSTYKQCFEESSTGVLKFNSISYNDQPGGGSLTSAHAKGFFIWNENGGIHVIHSYPKTPFVSKTTTTDRDYNADKDSKFLISWSKTALVGKKNFNLQQAQHSICIALSAIDLVIIPKYLIYTNIVLQTINTIVMKPSSLGNFKIDEEKNKELIEKDKSIDITSNDTFTSTPTTFSNLDTFISTHITIGTYWMKKIKLLSWSNAASAIVDQSITSDLALTNMHFNKIMDHNFTPNSKGNSYFVQTSNKNSRLVDTVHGARNPTNALASKKYHIIWNYIADHSLFSHVKKWVSQTQIKDYKGTLPVGKNMVLVEYFSYEWAKTAFVIEGAIYHIRKSVRTDFDHSKLMYGFDTNRQNGVFCFGDSNMQNVQEERGGGVFCSKDMHFLVEYYAEHVTSIQKVNPDSYVKVKTVAIPFNTYGLFSIDFTAISSIHFIGYTSKELEMRNSDGNSFKPKVFFTQFKSGKILPLLLDENVKTETFKLYFYPSERGTTVTTPTLSTINELLFCDISIPWCNFEDSISFEILEDSIATELKTNENITDQIIKDEYGHENVIQNLDFRYTLVPNSPALKITGISNAKDLLFISGLVRKILSTNKGAIRLIEKTNPNVIYPFGLYEANSLCYHYQSPQFDGASSLYHYPNCLDILALCIHHYSTPFLLGIDQVQLYNNVQTIITSKAIILQTNQRCIAQPTTMNDDDDQ